MRGFSRLANLYWRVRACRNYNQRRKWYYKIVVEKKRLLAEGVPAIELHLVCRVLANPHNQASVKRLSEYRQSVAEGTSPWCQKPR